jgi:hypothetical protein
VISPAALSQQVLSMTVYKPARNFGELLFHDVRE